MIKLDLTKMSMSQLKDLGVLMGQLPADKLVKDVMNDISMEVSIRLLKSDEQKKAKIVSLESYKKLNGIY